MKDFYDFSKMKRVPHPFQNKIDRGEIKLKNHFDISDDEFNEKIQYLDADTRELAIEMRQYRKDKQILQEISEVEKSCNNQIPVEVINLLEKIKIHLSVK